MIDYMKLKINPYATLAKHFAEPASLLSMNRNLENTMRGAEYILGENMTESNAVYTTESFRVFLSDANTISIRAATGFLRGMYANTNATKCGSRLV